MDLSTESQSGYRLGRRAAIWGMIGSGFLAILKITAGLIGNSTAVFSDGVESAADVLTSGVVLGGMTLALKPPDADHPYGHGRAESIAGKTVATMLVITGVLIAINAAGGLIATQEPPRLYAVLTLLVSIAVKVWLSTYKMRLGRRIGSASLQADAWNDRVDILSALAALVGAGLAVFYPERLLIADRVGGFVVAMIILYTGLKIFRDTSLELMDTMPPPELIGRVRDIAEAVPGAVRIEKCLGRKSGLGYFIDLHLEVNPMMTVRESHTVAHLIKDRVRAALPEVLDVLVHVEPMSRDES